MTRLDESSIYVSLKSLRSMLYEAQYLMQKTDRVVYGTPLMHACADTIKWYVKAYTARSEKKVEYLAEAIGAFNILRIDLEFCVDHNMIHYKKKENDVNTQKVELFKIVARVDNELCKWEASLARGKTIVE